MFCCSLLALACAFRSAIAVAALVSPSSTATRREATWWLTRLCSTKLALKEAVSWAFAASRQLLQPLLCPSQRCHHQRALQGPAAAAGGGSVADTAQAGAEAQGAHHLLCVLRVIGHIHQYTGAGATTEGATKQHGQSAVQVWDVTTTTTAAAAAAAAASLVLLLLLLAVGQVPESRVPAW
jgi:hypothetical protein